jgi:hypothetical protein
MFSKPLVAVILFVITALTSHAEVLVYTGVIKLITPLLASGHRSSRAFLVCDVETGATIQISYNTRYNVVTDQFEKKYRMSDLQTFKQQTTTSISGGYTVFSRLQSITNETGNLTESVWIAGKNATLKTSKTTTEFFPRRFSLQAKRAEVRISEYGESAEFRELEGSFVLRSHDTIVLNEAGEIFTQTVDRLKTYLESRGYAEDLATPAQ